VKVSFVVLIEMDVQGTYKPEIVGVETLCLGPP
jgi:hypothetical protein